MSHPVVHWEIGGRDMAALRDFYGTAFGWQMVDAGPEYTLVPPADGEIGGGIMKARDDIPAYVTVYIAVEDLDEKLADVTRLGGKTIVTPTEIDQTMSMALFADPEGNVVGLLEQR